MSGITEHKSKLPSTKTSIFSVMSSMANKHNAINLSQGFPNFETDLELKNLVTKAMKDGYNQYPPDSGAQVLREQIVKKGQISFSLIKFRKF